jgi:hypothetical protein
VCCGVHRWMRRTDIVARRGCGGKVFRGAACSHGIGMAIDRLARSSGTGVSPGGVYPRRIERSSAR